MELTKRDPFIHINNYFNLKIEMFRINQSRFEEDGDFWSKTIKQKELSLNSINSLKPYFDEKNIAEDELLDFITKTEVNQNALQKNINKLKVGDLSKKDVYVFIHELENSWLMYLARFLSSAPESKEIIVLLETTKDKTVNQLESKLLEARQKILIADDVPVNRAILEDLVDDLGYVSQSVTNGKEVFESIKKDVPDLILLDIEMPEMNGIEVLERLKADDELKTIRVVMVSAIEEISSVTECLEKGADDYLFKPFDPIVLQARIRGSLEKKLNTDKEKRNLKQMIDYNSHLEDMVKKRTKDLAIMNEKLTIMDKAKSDFLNLVSHEFRTPMNGIMGFGEMMMSEDTGIEDKKRFKGIFDKSTTRLMTILDQAILLNQIDLSPDQFLLTPVPLRLLLVSAKELVLHFANEKGVEIEYSKNNIEEINVLVNNELMIEAMSALLRTSIRLSKKGEKVSISHSVTGDMVTINIQSSGINIPEKEVENLFQIFSTGETFTAGGDLGIEPAISFRIIELFEGKLELENLSPPGVSFQVQLLQSK